MLHAVKLIKQIWQKPLARAITSLIILGGLFCLLPVETLWDTLKKISVSAWLLTLSAFIIGHLIGVAKWTLLINTGHNSYSYFSIF